MWNATDQVSYVRNMVTYIGWHRNHIPLACLSAHLQRELGTRNSFRLKVRLIREMQVMPWVHYDVSCHIRQAGLAITATVLRNPVLWLFIQDTRRNLTVHSTMVFFICALACAQWTSDYVRTCLRRQSMNYMIF